MTTPVQLARAYLEDRIENVADYLLPGGKKSGSEWRGMRKSKGGPGDSVSIHIAKDSKLGMCKGFASGERATSDIVATWMRLRNIPEGDWAAFFNDLRLFAGQDFGYGSNGANGSHERIDKSKSAAPSVPFGDARWKECVAAVTAKDLKELVDWRGFSIGYVTWLRDKKLIGLDDGQWAFPVFNDGVLTSIHVVVYMGHLGQKNRWFYEPEGFPPAPFVIGDLASAEYVHVFESQWDMFAIDDILEIHHSKKWALVSTRGSSNAKLLAGLPANIQGIKLWPQNDSAGQQWAANAASFANGRTVKVVRTPENLKDPAEWIEAGATKEMVEKACKDAMEVELPPQKATPVERVASPDPVLEEVQDEEAAAQERRFEAFTKATVKGSELLKIEIPPRQIIIKDWLKEGDLGFIFAYRGSGKTWLALMLMSALAEGLVCGPWPVHDEKSWPVLYVDGEMPVDDIRSRIKAINGGTVPENFHLLNHEILYSKSELVINLASPKDQQLVTKMCAEKAIKVLLLDNLGCLFTGVGENDADEWEKVLPWLLELRRAMITVIIIHHTGVNTTRMRGTSKREDAAAWVMRLDDKKEGSGEPGARFITRFLKYRGSEVILDYEWTIKPEGKGILISHREASRHDVLLQWVRNGVDTAKDIAAEMGISSGQVSKLATQLIAQDKLKKSGRRYEVA